MHTLRFVITRQNGSPEHAAIDGDRAVIGHGAHCDVRLGLDEAAYEHVSIEREGAEVYAAAIVTSPAVTLAGSPLTRAVVKAGEPLTFAGVTVSVTLEQPAKAASGDGGSSARRIGLLAAATLLFVVVMLARAKHAGSEELPRELPPLFEGAAMVCPQGAPDQAAALADERFALAEVRRERYPFVPRDGVAAVSLYDQAAACFRTANDGAASAAAEAAAKSLRNAITIDLRARLLRLEYAVRVKDTGLAAHDLVVLRSVTEGTPGTFNGFLDDMQRRLQAK